MRILNSIIPKKALKAYCILITTVGGKNPGSAVDYGKISHYSRENLYIQNGGWTKNFVVGDDVFPKASWTQKKTWDTNTCYIGLEIFEAL